ncbi:MAG: methyltransferase [Pseudorhodobacter sp.]
MADMPDTDPAPRRRAGSDWIVNLARSRRFQAFAARVPGLRWVARRQGEAIFKTIQGFVESQVLMALVELGLLHRLESGPAKPGDLAPGLGLPEDRLAVLLQAGAAAGLLRRRRDGRFALSVRGASLLAVPGLEGMILHHAILYRDLADPVAFLRGETRPDLAEFWPYVFGAGAAEDPGRATRYSRLMAESQVLVAEDTLALADLRGVRSMMDVGGGTGAFLEALGRHHPGIERHLFELPAVLDGAGARLGQGVRLHPGSFRDDPLPPGADAISLVRVLYDHSDDTVRALLARVHAALPPGGLVLVSEPMSGGMRPDPVTDVYFAFYTMAMRTGRTRSAARIAELLGEAGFDRIAPARSRRPFVTSLVTARRPA